MSFIPRRNFGARLEPLDTVLHGAGQDVDSFREYAKVFPKTQRPAVYMTYISVTGDVQSVVEWGTRLQQEIASLDEPNVYLQIGLNMTGGNDTGEGMDAVVAGGAKDENLAAFCDAIANIRLPAYVRIGYEFEGAWNGYQPESFKRAFVHITHMMRARDLNIATVWCSSGASAGNVSMETLISYYPGDEWVDWWGIDTFEANELLSEHTRQFCEAAGTHNKPVMIGESTPREIGVLEGQASWDKWFALYFALIHRQPEVKLFSYINWEWVYWSDTLGFQWHHWGDCRIEQNAVVTANFREEMSLPLYQHVR
jgi:hypothetical protein